MTDVPKFEYFVTLFQNQIASSVSRTCGLLFNILTDVPTFEYFVAMFQIVSSVAAAERRCLELNARYRQEVNVRKQYHNELVELKGPYNYL